MDADKVGFLGYLLPKNTMYIPLVGVYHIERASSEQRKSYISKHKSTLETSNFYMLLKMISTMGKYDYCFANIYSNH